MTDKSTENPIEQMQSWLLEIICGLDTDEVIRVAAKMTLNQLHYFAKLYESRRPTAPEGTPAYKQKKG